MHEILKSRNAFFVKEHTGIFKASNSYDVLDPETQEVLMECREPKLGFITKMFRFTNYKRMMGFNIFVKTPDGQQVLRVKRGFTFFLSKVEVFDENDNFIGMFKQKFFSIGGGFRIYDAEGTEICRMKGKWHGWNFRFFNGDTQYGTIAKKWAGLGKELFTSADNYMIGFEDALEADNPLRILIIAAGLSIDLVYNER